jgi:hypothetical protein
MGREIALFHALLLRLSLSISQGTLALRIVLNKKNHRIVLSQMYSWTIKEFLFLG